MFKINAADKSVYLTRGDVCLIGLAVTEKDGSAHTFKQGDVVRLSVFEKKNCENVVLQKDYPITADSEEIEIYLSGEDTKFGGIINKPTDYWYELELNPDTHPQTVIGYDDDGPKLFRIYPEGDRI